MNQISTADTNTNSGDTNGTRLPPPQLKIFSPPKKRPLSQRKLNYPPSQKKANPKKLGLGFPPKTANSGRPLPKTSGIPKIAGRKKFPHPSLKKTNRVPFGRNKTWSPKKFAAATKRGSSQSEPLLWAHSPNQRLSTSDFAQRRPPARSASPPPTRPTPPSSAPPTTKGVPQENGEPRFVKKNLVANRIKKLKRRSMPVQIKNRTPSDIKSIPIGIKRRSRSRTKSRARISRTSRSSSRYQTVKRDFSSQELKQRRRNSAALATSADFQEKLRALKEKAELSQDNSFTDVRAHNRSHSDTGNKNDNNGSQRNSGVHKLSQSMRDVLAQMIIQNISLGTSAQSDRVTGNGNDPEGNKSPETGKSVKAILDKMDIQALNLEAFYPASLQGTQMKSSGSDKSLRKEKKKKKSSSSDVFLQPFPLDKKNGSPDSTSDTEKKKKKKRGEDSVDNSNSKYMEQLWTSPESPRGENWGEQGNYPESVRNMFDPKCIETRGYHAEFGDPKAEEKPKLSIDGKEEDIKYFTEFLLPVEHVHYMGESGHQKACLTVEVKPTLGKKHRALLKSKQSSLRILLEGKDFIKSFKKVCPNFSSFNWKIIKDRKLSEELASIEEKEKRLLLRYKFGVLLVKDGQNEDEIFSNKEGDDPDFEEFIHFLGDRVELLGFNKYSGGLDTKNQTTGKHSVYTKHKGYEIMFHISTLLPFQERDTQRVERKRHIGNDVVVVIFKTGIEPFDPLIMTNQFNHIFVIVEKIKASGDTKYKICIINKSGVKPYSPKLNSPPMYVADKYFKDFLMTKLINSERAALRSPEFRQKMMRTTKEFLNNMYKIFVKKK